MICSLHQSKSNCCSVNFTGFTNYKTRRANEMASEWSYKNQNSSYRGKFPWNLKGNLVRVSEEFELSEFEFTQVGWNPREMVWVNGSSSYRGSTVCQCVDCCNFLNCRLPCERNKLQAKKRYPHYIENSPGFCLTIYIAWE